MLECVADGGVPTESGEGYGEDAGGLEQMVSFGKARVARDIPVEASKRNGISHHYWHNNIREPLTRFP